MPETPMMPEEEFRTQTLAHIHEVQKRMETVVNELRPAALRHDASKLKDPEAQTFRKFTPKLKDCTYGSDEYKRYLSEMQVALLHHYENNRHHPEHFEHGIAGMTLVDLVEMLADWKASGERHVDGGSMAKSLGIQKRRFDISDQLDEILWNTARELGWLEQERQQ